MRRRVLHFIGIGAAAFALARWRPPAQSAPPPLPATVTDGRDAEVLYQAGVALGLDRNDVVVQSRLLRDMRFLDHDETDRGSLYRDALRLGLASSDVVVRRRVIERMEARLRAAGLADEPSEADLRAYLETHRAVYRIPPRVAFVQVFFSRRRRGAHLEADAGAALDRLSSDDPDRAAARGDALPIALPAGLVTERDVARVLGPDLAAHLFALPAGRWSTPIASPYGLHLVWVTERVAASDPSLDSVRAQLRAAVREARADATLQEGLAALRAGDVRTGHTKGMP